MNDNTTPEKSKESNSFADRLKKAPKKQWIKFCILTVLAIAFFIWTGYYLSFLFIALVFDSYILKYIPWSFWKRSKNKSFKQIMEWADAIGFALVAVYFINTFFFQNYQIPSSSLEKSLLVGDFLLVSKMSYGTRSPMTPLSFPLAQHTLPVLDTKSYIEKPQVNYQRFTGTGSIERGDIVVFNFPTGDTVALKQQAQDYYSLIHQDPRGREGLWTDKAKYGDIVYRPVDRRENYVKRCIGLPGETIELKDDEVYINGHKIEDPQNMQLMYYVQTDGSLISAKLFEELGISKDDYLPNSNRENPTSLIQKPMNSDLGGVNQQEINYQFYNDSLRLTKLGFKAKDNSFGTVYLLPLTKEMVSKLENKSFVLSVVKEKEYIEERELNNGKILDVPFYYPLGFSTGWTRDAYGPLWIPKKGETITFDKDVEYKVATYERAIKNYEHNDFKYENGKIYINGKEAQSYTFKYNYYFMMGDNRHNSADSRSWGFVPEDHIVGSPLFVWLSLDKDKGWFDGKIRWNRIFSSVKRD